MAELELAAADTKVPQSISMVGKARSSDPIDDWRAELDDFYATMHNFPDMEPDEIFMFLSGASARASEMRSRLVRVESRRNTYFRTSEIDPFLNACEFQFKLISRYQAVRDFDLRMTTGAPA